MDRESKDMGFKPGQPLTPYDNLEGLNALFFPSVHLRQLRQRPIPSGSQKNLLS